MSRSYTIMDLYPEPSTVSIGGRNYRVPQFTVEDYAAITRWASHRRTHPLDEIRDYIKDLNEAERKKAMQDANRQASEWWAKTLGDPEFDDALYTEQGIVVFLTLAIRRHNDLTTEEFWAMCEVITPTDYANVRRAAMGVDPQTELERLIECPEEFEIEEEGEIVDVAPPVQEGVEWADVIDKVCERHPAWTLDYIGSLTLAQLGWARHGTVRGSGPTQMSPAEWAAIAMKGD